MKCYKVFRVGKNGKLYSFLTPGWLKKEYDKNKTMYANKDVLKLGYGIFVFQNEEDAINFIDGHTDVCQRLFPHDCKEIQVWECSTDLLFTPEVKSYRLFPSDLVHFVNKKLVLEIINYTQAYYRSQKSINSKITELTKKYSDSWLQETFPGVCCKKLQLIKQVYSQMM